MFQRPSRAVKEEVNKGQLFLFWRNASMEKANESWKMNLKKHFW